jgi:hypothetical protein
METLSCIAGSILALALAACTPAKAEARAADTCVTDYHSLPSDHGWRRYRIVDGRHCWYVEGERGRGAVAQARHVPHAIRLDKTVRLSVSRARDVPWDRVPSAPAAPQSPPPPVMISDQPPAAPSTMVASLVDERTFLAIDANPTKGDRLSEQAPTNLRNTTIVSPNLDNDHRIGALALAIAALLAVAMGLLTASRQTRLPDTNHWS